MTGKPAPKRSQKIKDDLAVVRITARTGRLPLVSDDVEWINPTTKRVVPGVILEFGDDGVCELDPVRDAATIKLFREWMADGYDPRIVEQGVMEIAKDALLPPFPKWDSTAPETVVQMVDTLGLDPVHCLRYELQKGEAARSKIVKSLEAKVDAPPVEDALSEPEM
jgi:hypothetical protein